MRNGLTTIVRSAGRMTPKALLVGCLVAIALIPLPSSASLVGASEREVTIVGRVCLAPEKSDSCSPTARPGRRLIVRAPGGLEAVTDDAGLFSMAAVPGRTRAQGPGGTPLARLSHIPLQVDVTPLGPSARAPDPVWVDLIPESVVAVDLVVLLPEPEEAASARSGPATGGVPALELHDDALRYHVPLVLPPGHEAIVDGDLLPNGEAGDVLVPVLLGEREGFTIVIDRAPDGRARVLRQVVLRVPRPRGGELLVCKPIETIASIDLPPTGLSVAPGPLRFLVSAKPGSRIRLGAEAFETLDEEGTMLIETRISKSGLLEIVIEQEDAPPARTEVWIPIDPRQADQYLLAADLRMGLTALGAFGEGSIVAEVRRRIASGVLVLGAELDDEDISRLGRGGPLFVARRPDVIAYSPDSVRHGLIFGDESTRRHANSAGLNFWGAFEGPAGRVALGSGRTSLDMTEVGRFDRAVVGPVVDIEGSALQVGLRLVGGADLSGTRLMESSLLKTARVELSGTGGTIYSLPHREIAEGSERVWIETRDPRTGLVFERRLLARGRDYELSNKVGLLMMARPVGWGSSPPAGRLAASSLARQSVIVVDYLWVSAIGAMADGGHGGARVSASVGNLEIGFSGAGSWRASQEDGEVPAGGLEHGLRGADLRAEPWPWLSVQLSAARSRGDSFGELASIGRSRDGGYTYFSPMPIEEIEDSAEDASVKGHGSSLRVKLGTDEAWLSGWWSFRSREYADAAFPMEGPHRQLGALGRAPILGSSLSLMVDHAEGRGPWRWKDESNTIATARLERRLGDISLAAEGLHRRAATYAVPGDPSIEGDATAAGAELIWHLADSADLSIGHLQAVSYSGAHPAGRDPTFTSVGAKVRGQHLGEIGVRGGLKRDLEPVVAASWRREGSDGADSSYGEIALGSDEPWAETETMSVSGVSRVHSSGVATFVESRLFEDDDGPVTGRALGASLGEGPWTALVTYERGERLGDDGLGEAVRDGLYGSFGVLGARFSAVLFGEAVRSFDEETNDAAASPGAYPSASLLGEWNAGLSTRVQPAGDLSVGGRLLMGRARIAGEPEPVSRKEASFGAAWRPPGRGLARPAVLVHYGLRQDGKRPERDALLVSPLRMQLARLGLIVAALTGPEVRILASGAIFEIVDGELEGIISRQGVLLTRLGWPIGALEPALEGGARAVLGADVPAQVEPTLRAEALAILGPARVGVGAVLAGFAGTGVEDPMLGSDTSRIYLVLRGAVQ